MQNTLTASSQSSGPVRPPQAVAVARSMHCLGASPSTGEQDLGNIYSAVNCKPPFTQLVAIQDTTAA